MQTSNNESFIAPFQQLCREWLLTARAINASERDSSVSSLLLNGSDNENAIVLARLTAVTTLLTSFAFANDNIVIPRMECNL